MKYIENEPIYTDQIKIADALSVRDLAKRLSKGYLIISSGLYFLKRHISFVKMDENEIDMFSKMTVSRNGAISPHGYNARFYIGEIQKEGNLEYFLKTYLADGIVILADALAKHKYFEHDPSLEMVYHLRNAIAHGNTFNITAEGEKRLKKYPAHTRDSWRRGGDKIDYEITKELNGWVVLFEYMSSGDILDIFDEVAICLQKKATGQPIIPFELR